jgi:hypothetical protein
MKKSIVSFSGIILFALLFAETGSISSNPLLGSWVFSVNQAPPEYSRGIIVFENNKDDIITGKIKFHSGFEVPITKINRVNEKITFEVFVEGTPARAVVTLKDNQISGFVETYEGNMPFTAKKEVPEN